MIDIPKNHLYNLVLRRSHRRGLGVSCKIHHSISQVHFSEWVIFKEQQVLCEMCIGKMGPVSLKNLKSTRYILIIEKIMFAKVISELKS